MDELQKTNKYFSRWLPSVITIIFSGLCWYVSYGLTGQYWYLFWMAPIPVMILSFQGTAKRAFIISFIAYLFGRLSWFSYLSSVATIVPATIFTLLQPLIFALLMLLARKIVTRTNKWWAMFAFPVFWTAFESLLVQFSADGSAGSIAYSQADLLPLIQIASVTGILGISFIITFIPSAIAVGWYHRRDKHIVKYISVVSTVIIAAVFLFGAIRIDSQEEKNTIKVGLVSLNEHLHNITDNPNAQKEKLLAEDYAQEIATLAKEGAQFVVLPERAINITKETDSTVTSILSLTAKQNHVVIITGYTNFNNKPERNSAMVIDAEGKLIADYNKVHLVTGLENNFTPGNQPGLFTVNGAQVGVAICKDLDFPGYIKNYGEKNAGCLFVPAWDFEKDDWLHARMALLRSVENGCAEVRTARQGRLTINNYYGKVNFEASSATGKAATLTGTVSLQHTDTIYARFGNWFGLVNAIVATCFMVVLIKKPKKQ